MSEGGVVIVGSGHAGLHAAASLRELGYQKTITMINGEADLPYQRPPLSKAFMLGKLQAAGLSFRNREYFEQNCIELVSSDRAATIHRIQKRVTTASGRSFPYEHLILSTGARNRTISVPGVGSAGVHFLRSISDAVALRNHLQGAKNVVIVGGGFIGMEFAAVASTFDAKVSVLEAAPRLMARAVSLEVSEYMRRRHVGRRVSISFGESVVCLNEISGAVVSVKMSGGEMVPADLVLIGVGVQPNDELASASGLAVENGILVDEFLATSDPAISAIGDCAVFPNAHSECSMRVESVQNAVDQARTVADRITGNLKTYAAAPWFWSDQADDKLQIAGIALGNETNILSDNARRDVFGGMGTLTGRLHGGEGEAKRFSIFRFRRGRLVCVESVNKSADHMAARALLKQGKLQAITPRELIDAGFELKAFK